MTDRQRIEQLERELEAAVTIHERYVSAVDLVLGEPRDLPYGWILEQHLAAIQRLKPKSPEGTHHWLRTSFERLPPDDQIQFWSLLMEAFAWRGWATSKHHPRPEMVVSCVVQMADLFAKHGMELEEYT